MHTVKNCELGIIMELLSRINLSTVIENVDKTVYWLLLVSLISLALKLSYTYWLHAIARTQLITNWVLELVVQGIITAHSRFIHNLALQISLGSGLILTLTCNIMLWRWKYISKKNTCGCMTLAYFCFPLRLFAATPVMSEQVLFPYHAPVQSSSMGATFSWPLYPMIISQFHAHGRERY